jgi:hypothetical protein
MREIILWSMGALIVGAILWTWPGRDNTPVKVTVAPYEDVLRGSGGK